MTESAGLASTRQLRRFILAGMVNTGATTLLYWVLLASGLPPGSSYTLVFIIGIGFAWAANGRYAFGASVPLGSLLVYPLVYLPTWAGGWLVLHFLIERGIADWLAGPLAAVAMVPPSFLLNRFFYSRTWH